MRAHRTADVLLQGEYFNGEEIFQLSCSAIHRFQRWPAVTPGDAHAIERHRRFEGFHSLWPWRRECARAGMQLDLTSTEQGSKDVPPQCFVCLCLRQELKPFPSPWSRLLCSAEQTLTAATVLSSHGRSEAQEQSLNIPRLSQFMDKSAGKHQGSRQP